MAWRTGTGNPPLGCPDLNVAHDADSPAADFPLGTIINGYDSANEINQRLMWVVTGADHTVGEDVDVTTDGTYTTSDAADDTGTADAIVASTDGQYVWVALKPPQPLS